MSDPETDDLTVDPQRDNIPDRAGTGIFVRARSGDSWGSYDIVRLDERSLRRWLRSRGGENTWAENVVCMLLGHTV